MLLTLVWFGWTCPSVDGREPIARLGEDGRSFLVVANGLTEFRSTWSATIQGDGGSELILDSKAGEQVPGASSVLRFGQGKVDLLFHLEPRADAPAVMARVGIRNHGPSPVRLLSVSPVVADWKLPSNLERWFLTGLHPVTPFVQGVRAIDQTYRVHEYGGYYHSGGDGFFFGPVGEPVAYVSGRFARHGENRMFFNFAAEMSGVRVDPGETRWGQQIVLLVEPPRTALPRWADWVAESHRARRGSRALTGWGSWYSYGAEVTGKDVLAQVEVVRRNPARLRPDVILIDRGHEISGRFPEGLPYYARAIAGIGAMPGLKLELDRIDDPYAAIRQATGDGFRYLKMGWLEPAGERPDPKLTRFEIKRKRYAAAREAAGPDTYLLDCPLLLERASIGYVDASRTGRTAERKHIVPAMNEVLRSYFLNGRWFAIDNDHFYLGTDIANVSEIVGGWPVVRTWMSMVGMSCGAAFTSDPLHQPSLKPFWRNFEVMNPPAREQTEVSDLATAWFWPRLVGRVRRPWGDATVALLWNPENKEKSVELRFLDEGMDPAQRYAVWSFWDNRYLGLVQQFWKTPPLAPSASQHLRFTPIPASPVPVLIGSNLHIYCGAAEIQSIRSSRSSMDIALTDAGARAGDLFVYSRYRPILRAAEGLTVTAVDQAGENVWRLRLRDRVPGATQRMELSIDLPVTLRWWFWAMILVMIASVALALWKYVAWLRIERKHTLAVERSRIARDLHDDLGANLAEIAMISDLAQEQLPENDPARKSFDEIFARAESNTRRLGEIVWAINPANDSLEKFAGFLGKFAQDYLSLARVGCRLEMPGELPAVSLNSVQRHHLFLAAKEAIHNAVRHGKPTEVIVRLVLRGSILTLAVEDNGSGFDMTLPATSSRGLANMRDRLEKIGGGIDCQSAPGRGTVVVFTVPLKP